MKRAGCPECHNGWLYGASGSGPTRCGTCNPMTPAAAALDRITALHGSPNEDGFCGHCLIGPWPCPTFRMADGVLSIGVEAPAAVLSNPKVQDGSRQ